MGCGYGVGDSGQFAVGIRPLNLNQKFTGLQTIGYSDFLSFLEMLTRWGEGGEREVTGVKWASHPN